MTVDIKIQGARSDDYIVDRANTDIVYDEDGDFETITGSLLVEQEAAVALHTMFDREHPIFPNTGSTLHLFIGGKVNPLSWYLLIEAETRTVLAQLAARQRASGRDDGEILSNKTLLVYVQYNEYDPRETIVNIHGTTVAGESVMVDMLIPSKAGIL